jgi:GAF domain-containing protein
MSKKDQTYKDIIRRIEALIDGETDEIAVMATVACELYHAFDSWNWVGFYRRVDADTLKVGPYQGSHGCLEIDLSRGVCGKCAREAAVQLENDVTHAGRAGPAGDRPGWVRSSRARYRFDGA